MYRPGKVNRRCFRHRTWFRHVLSFYNQESNRHWRPAPLAAREESRQRPASAFGSTIVFGSATVLVYYSMLYSMSILIYR